MKLLVALALVISLAGGAGAERPPPTTLKVLDTGKAPQRSLRFAPKTAKGTLAATITARSGYDGDGKPAKLKEQPSVRMTIEYSLSVVTAQRFRVDYVVRKPEVSGDHVQDIVRDAIKRLDGVKGSVVVTHRGVVEDETLVPPQRASAETVRYLTAIQALMGRAFPQVPEPAVGVGARWRTEMKLKLGQASLVEEMTYDLVELDGSKAKLATAIKSTGRGTGTLTATTKLDTTVDLARGIATLRLETRTEIKIDDTTRVDEMELELR